MQYDVTAQCRAGGLVYHTAIAVVCETALQVIELLRSSMPPLGDQAVQISGLFSLCKTRLNKSTAQYIDDVHYETNPASKAFSQCTHIPHKHMVPNNARVPTVHIHVLSEPLTFPACEVVAKLYFGPDPSKWRLPGVRC